MEQKPAELAWAEKIVGLAERFHVLPSAVMAESSETLRLLAMLDENCGRVPDAE